MQRVTLVGAALLTALALTWPAAALAGRGAGCSGGRCSARAADGPRRPAARAVGGVGRAVGRVLPRWRN